MPVAEENKQAPSTSYGEGVQRDEFVKATAPEESPVIQPEVGPALVPQAAQPLQQELAPPVDEIVAGQVLDAESSQALFQPGVAPSPGRDLAELSDWIPLFDYLARQPGASDFIRGLAAEAKRQVR